MRSCVIVFPLYQSLNKLELAFLENGMEKTKGFKQVIVAPEGLVIDNSFGTLEQLEVKRFAKHYFESISGYNQLLLSAGFYTAFSLFDYMLIHQSDAYLFKNELSNWCNKDYDYIGAPWFRPDKLNKNSVFNFIEKTKLSFKQNKLYCSRYNKVGNGGLSLRKINTALKILSIAPQSVLDLYKKSEGIGYNEDIFWSLEAPLILTNYKVPKWDEALYFAVEFHPIAAYDHLNKNLPFGCHAPLKHNPEFWKKFIPSL